METAIPKCNIYKRSAKEELLASNNDFAISKLLVAIKTIIFLKKNRFFRLLLWRVLFILEEKTPTLDVNTAPALVVRVCFSVGDSGKSLNFTSTKCFGRSGSAATSAETSATALMASGFGVTGEAAVPDH